MSEFDYKLNDTNIQRIQNMNLRGFVDDAEGLNIQSIGYCSNHIIQTHLPHKEVDKNEYIKKAGNYTVTIIAPSEYGLPFGATPRLIMIWLMTRAVKYKTSEIYLGETMSSFLTDMGLESRGGERGDITRIKKQVDKLMKSTISITYKKENGMAFENIPLFEKGAFWWDRHNLEKSAFEGVIKINEKIFDELLNRPVPLSMESVSVLKKSSLALDIYCWLTWKMSHLSQTLFISWESLKIQFGSDYSDNRKGLINFKQQFLIQLKKVSSVYPEARIEISDNNKGLILYPSPTSVPFKLVSIDRASVTRDNSEILCEPQESATKDIDPIINIMIDEFGLAKKSAIQLFQENERAVIENAINAVRAWVKSKDGNVRSKAAILRKAISEGWVADKENGKSCAPGELKDSTEMIDKRLLEIKNNDVFYKFMVSLRQELGDGIFAAWFINMDLDKVTKDTIILSVDSKFRRDHVYAQYAKKFERLWMKLFNEDKIANIIERN